MSDPIQEVRSEGPRPEQKTEEPTVTVTEPRCDDGVTEDLDDQQPIRDTFSPTLWWLRHVAGIGIVSGAFLLLVSDLFGIVNDRLEYGLMAGMATGIMLLMITGVLRQKRQEPIKTNADESQSDGGSGDGSDEEDEKESNSGGDGPNFLVILSMICLAVFFGLVIKSGYGAYVIGGLVFLIIFVGTMLRGLTSYAKDEIKALGANPAVEKVYLRGLVFQVKENQAVIMRNSWHANAGELISSQLGRPRFEEPKGYAVFRTGYCIWFPIIRHNLVGSVDFSARTFSAEKLYAFNTEDDQNALIRFRVVVRILMNHLNPAKFWLRIGTNIKTFEAFVLAEAVRQLQILARRYTIRQLTGNKLSTQESEGAVSREPIDLEAENQRLTLEYSRWMKAFGLGCVEFNIQEIEPPEEIRRRAAQVEGEKLALRAAKIKKNRLKELGSEGASADTVITTTAATDIAELVAGAATNIVNDILAIAKARINAEERAHREGTAHAA